MDTTSYKQEGALMKIYASTTLFWGHSFERICQMAKREQLAGVEIWVEQMQFQKWSIEEMKYFLNSYGLKATIHANSWDLNLSSLNEGIRNQSLCEIEKSMIFAKELQVPSITVHPGKSTVNNRFYDEHQKVMRSVLQRLDGLVF